MEVKTHLQLFERYMTQAASEGKSNVAIPINNVDTVNMAQFLRAFKQETEVSIHVEGDHILLDWSHK